MSYIGGPLPGKERDEEYPQDIGKETFQKAVKPVTKAVGGFYEKHQETIDPITGAIGEAWDETRTFKDVRNPLNLPHNVGAVGARGLEVGAKVIDKTFEGVSDITGIYRGYFDVADFFLPFTPSAMKFAKGFRKAKKVSKVVDTAFDARLAERVYRTERSLKPGFNKSMEDFFSQDLGEVMFLKKSPSAERYANIYGAKVPMTQISQASTDWFKIGGGLDTELEKVLTVGKGIKNQKLLTIDELEDLAKTNKGMQARLDKYKSLMATPPPAFPGDNLIYGYESKLLARTAALSKHADYIPAYHKSLEFHHASMKALEYSIHRKAREFLKAGKITEVDLVRLHNVGEAKNIQSGSRAAAGIDMHRQTHNLLHKDIMLPKGIQPSHIRTPIKPLSSKPKNISSELWKKMKEISPDITKFDTEYVTAWGDKGIEKWKKFRKTESYKLTSADSSSELMRLRDEIESIDNIEDLINFRSDMIDNIVTPMTDEALLLERALDKLSTTEVLALDKDITPLKKARKMQKAQEKAKKIFKQEQIVEDAMKVAYD